MIKWEMVRLGDVLEYEQPTKYIVESDLYSDAYETPVLTAGKTFVLGYTNETENIYTNLPVIIFDDFTTATKFVNFPFKVKSSAMKILRPTEKIDIRYIYYLMSTIKIDTGLHKRYWISKYAEIQVQIPPLEEQKKIVDELDEISDLIAKRKEQIEKLDLLVKAKFIEMFGDPITNPMGWESNRLEQFIVFLTSGSRGWAKYFSEKGEMFLTIKNVKNNKISTSNMQFIEAPNNKEACRTKVQENDLLISITADLGRTGVVDKVIAEHGAYINQHLSLIRLDINQINPCYVSYFLETEGGKNQFESKNQSAVKAGLNFDAIKSLNIVCPPLDIQNQFVAYVQQVEENKIKLQAGLAQLELLYKQRMQYYFE